MFLIFFSTIFSFLKLVCSFWQIARLQEFFLLLLFHHLLLPGWGTWMDGWRDRWRDGWMERTTTTGQTKDIIYKDLQSIWKLGKNIIQGMKFIGRIFGFPIIIQRYFGNDMFMDGWECTCHPQVHNEGWMDGKWLRNSFLLDSSSLANHGG